MNWSISRNGTEIGEWTEQDVRTFLSKGALLGSDLYWKEGMTEWKPLAEFVKPQLPPPFIKPQTEQETNGIDLLLLILAIIGYFIVGLIFAGIESGSFNSASIFGRWLVNALITGMIWFAYTRRVAISPSYLKSFLIFSGISVGLFILMLIGSLGRP